MSRWPLRIIQLPSRDIPRIVWDEVITTRVSPSPAACSSISTRESLRCFSNGEPSSCCSQT